MPNDLSAYAQEAFLADSVRTLCKRDKKYITILREIISTDKAYEGVQFGWQYKDIFSWSGAHVSILMKQRIIKYGYHSNSATHYWLAVDGEQLAKVVDEIERELTEVEEYDNSIQVQILDPEVIEQFKKLLSDGTDMLEYWNKWINPKIEGMAPVKKALLLSMASHGDKFGDRGRIHVLMYGDPGSAKSQLMNWIVYQIGAKFCSQRTSKVGLTADASGDEIVLGALPKAHKGIICIDELDKFNDKDRQGLLEAMEEGKVQIDVGKHSALLDAEVRAIAAANRLTHFSPELLDRFDFKFELKGPVGEVDKKITCSIIDHWFEDKEGYDGFDLKNYLNWIRDFEPSIPREVRDKVKLLMCMYIDLDESIRGSPRRKESILRVAFTIAKLHRRNVEVKDFLNAIKTLNPNLNGGKVQALEQLAGMK
ncbi:MAG: AAA family ATPase [Methanobacteriota archaeon]